MDVKAISDMSKEELEAKYGKFDQPVKVTANRAGVHVDLKSALAHPRMRYYVDLMEEQSQRNKESKE